MRSWSLGSAFRIAGVDAKGPVSRATRSAFESFVLRIPVWNSALNFSADSRVDFGADLQAFMIEPTDKISREKVKFRFGTILLLQHMPSADGTKKVPGIFHPLLSIRVFESIKLRASNTNRPTCKLVLQSTGLFGSSPPAYRTSWSSRLS